MIMNKNKTTMNTPTIRFPEFKDSGDWEEKKLGEVCERITKKVGNLPLTTMSISAGYGFVSQAEKFSRDISGEQYKNYIILEKGDVSYNKGNSKKFPQGCIYQLKNFEKVAVPNAFISFRFKNGYCSDFYQGYFDNNFHGKQLMKFITSGARSDGLLNINANDFFSIILPTPPTLTEQQHIADCLSSLDEIITAEGEKLESLKQHKKGLMQNLFPQTGETTPRLRFPEFKGSGDWEEKKLGEICENTFSGGTPSSGNTEYYGGEIPFIRSAEIARNKTQLFLTDLGYKNSSAKFVKKGDVLVALYGANSGDVAISKIEGAINQAILCLRTKNSNNFIYHFLTHKKEWIIATYIQGGQGNLSGEIVKSILILMPTPTEQQRIAECLSSLDDLITAESEKLESLKQHKKGLMQGLFPDPEKVV